MVKIEYRISNVNAQRESESKKYDLEERLISFAVRIINIVEALPNTPGGKHIAGQLICCGTSPAPNHAEAQSAESQKDFVRKMSNEFTKAIKQMNCPVHILNSDKDLACLSLQIARDTFWWYDVHRND